MTPSRRFRRHGDDPGSDPLLPFGALQTAVLRVNRLRATPFDHCRSLCVAARLARLMRFCALRPTKTLERVPWARKAAAGQDDEERETEESDES
jgi:hypothetical protein